MGPRFSEAGSFEHEYGTRWKQLHELHRQKEEALKKELAAEEEKLEAQMEYAKYVWNSFLINEKYNLNLELYEYINRGVDRLLR